MAKEPGDRSQETESPGRERMSVAEQSQAQALRVFIAWQLAQAMRRTKKAVIAALLKMSFTEIDRLLDAENDVALSDLRKISARMQHRGIFDHLFHV
ncbi:MAG TPA: hypothetical protein VGR73_09410 [Bryobacteraceae bacterium]|nr:hypothetical protein [Bryobacteraceae bacterium]